MEENQDKNFLKKYLYKEVFKWIKDNKSKKKLAIWGTGAEAKTFLEIVSYEFDFFIETNPRKRYFLGKNVFDPKILKKLLPNELNIIICSEFINEIDPLLKLNNFKSEENYIHLNKTKLKSIKMYAKDKNDHNKIIQLMNINSNYVRLMKDTDLSSENKYKWVVLIKNNSLVPILKSNLLTNNLSNYSFDFKLSYPIGFQEEILFLPFSISEYIFKNKLCYEESFWTLDPNSKKLYSKYNILFHKLYDKNNDSKIEKYDKLNNNNYSEILNYLKENSWLPPISDIRRWSEINNNSFLKKEFDYRRGYGCCLIITIREKANKKEVIRNVVSIMNREKFKFISSINLNTKEKFIIKRNTRGGCWSENSASINGGGPASLLVFKDINDKDKRLNNNIGCEEINRWRKTKEIIRGHYKDTDLDSSEVNWIHSSDDHFESIETINLLERNKEINRIISLFNL